METTIQAGLKIRYKAYTDYNTYERIVEGAVRFKRKSSDSCIYYNYIFYDKKGKGILWLKKVQIDFIEKIYTTVLEEPTKSWIKNIIEKLKIKIFNNEV